MEDPTKVTSKYLYALRSKYRMSMTAEEEERDWFVSLSTREVSGFIDINLQNVCEGFTCQLLGVNKKTTQVQEELEVKEKESKV